MALTRRVLCAAALMLSLTLPSLMVPVVGASAADGLSAKDAHEAMQNSGLVLIDVRTPREWGQTGIPAGAHPISIEEAGSPKAFLDQVSAVADRDQAVALICARGGRSAWAQTILAAGGWREVYNVSEGVLGGGGAPGWIGRDLPTDPAP